VRADARIGVAPDVCKFGTQNALYENFVSGRQLLTTTMTNARHCNEVHRVPIRFRPPPLTDLGQPSFIQLERTEAHGTINYSVNKAQKPSPINCGISSDLTDIRTVLFSDLDRT
jgi:hypothetical protein